MSNANDVLMHFQMKKEIRGNQVHWHKLLDEIKDQLIIYYK